MINLMWFSVGMFTGCVLMKLAERLGEFMAIRDEKRRR